MSRDSKPGKAGRESRKSAARPPGQGGLRAAASKAGRGAGAGHAAKAEHGGKTERGAGAGRAVRAEHEAKAGGGAKAAHGAKAQRGGGAGRGESSRAGQRGTGGEKAAHALSSLIRATPRRPAAKVPARKAGTGAARGAARPGGWKTCGRGHNYRGAGSCPVCWPGAKLAGRARKARG